MPAGYGKQWEQKVKEDFQSIENCSVDRIYDSVSGYRSISNISDFIVYMYPSIYYIEVKSHKGNTFPLANLTQYDKLKSKVGIPGVRTGMLLWFIDHDKCVYVPTATVEKMKEDGKKSVNVKMLDTNEYNIKIIPSVKKRTFLTCDYTVLKELVDGE
jgi:hypothetical protein